MSFHGAGPATRRGRARRGAARGLLLRPVGYAGRHGSRTGPVPGPGLPRDTPLLSQPHTGRALLESRPVRGRPGSSDYALAWASKVAASLTSNLPGASTF